MSDDEAAAKDDSASRKRRRRRSKDSQTKGEECGSCHNMTDSIAETKEKLDRELMCIKEIESLKQKQISLEEKNKDLEVSLECAHTSIEELKTNFGEQDKIIEELRKGVNSSTKQGKEEKERAIKLESHGPCNNLNFFNIPEEKEESFEKCEKVLRKFMEAKLKLSKHDAKEISLERVHRVGKPSSTDPKPRPLITKFTFHKDKEFVLSHAKNLHGTNFAVARDFLKEIVDKRKLLLPILKGGRKKEGACRYLSL